MPVDADSLGSYLRQERERRRVPLQDISAVTKIQLKFLEALEQDAYDQLPPAPFVAGFLRAYAQCLSLDSEAILTAYHARYRVLETSEEELPLPLASPPRRWVRLGVASISGLVVLGVVIALIAPELRRERRARNVVVPVAKAPQGVPESTTRGVPLTTSAPVVSRVEPAVPLPLPVQIPAAVEKQETGQAAGASAGSETVGPPNAVPGPAAPVGPEVLSAESMATLVLHARALQDTWLRVEIDGDKRREVLLGSGKSVSWEASERFLLTVGNARGTRLTLNGQEISLPSARNNVVRNFLLTRQLLN
jgi:cytoskeletal protein RodZ